MELVYERKNKRDVYKLENGNYLLKFKECNWNRWKYLIQEPLQLA